MRDRFRRLEDDRFDAIVVGAGTGGLTAAALLARRGLKVLVIDQHYVAGGNATVFRRRGYQFDVQLHYVGGCDRGGLLPRVLRAAGAVDLEFEEMDPDGFDTLIFPDFTFRVPKGIGAFRDRLREYFPREEKGIDRYVKLLRQLDGLVQFKSPLATTLAAARSLMLIRWRNATFGQFLDSCTSDERLKAVLSAQHGNYAQPPSRASLLIGAGICLHYLQGAYFPRGGGQVISDRLASAIEDYGGKILLCARAERILVENGKVAGVELNNKWVGRRVIRAPIVISNADLKRTMAELVGARHLQPETIRRVENFEMSPALGAVYLGIRRDLKAEGHPRTNYFVFPGYDHERAYAAAARGEFPERPLAYISIASLKDPANVRLAPAGITNLQILSIVPSQPAAWGVSEAEVRDGTYRRSEAYCQSKQLFARALIETAERAIPGIGRQVAYQEVATPLTQSRFTGSTGGTSYGIALTPAQFLSRRPGPRTEIGGLLLCGASCRTGHGIMGVALSGLMAAAEVVGYGLVREVMTASTD